MSAQPSAARDAAPEQPLVSVIIPTLNEERAVSTCLDAVLAQSYRNLEVLVIDGGSTDRTIELVEAYREVDDRVRWFHNPRRTQPAALNTALAELRADWIVRIDAHSTVPPDYVERIMGHLGTGRWGGVGGRKNGVAVSDQGRAIVAALGSRFGVGGSVYHYGTETQEVDHIPFGAYPTAVARELGGWNESTPSNEDYEFDFRVRTSGRALLFDPSIVISWHTRENVPDFFRQYRRYGHGKALTVLTHPSSAAPRHVLPGVLVAALAAGVAAIPFRPRWAAALIGPYLAGIGVATAVVAPTVAPPSRRYLPRAFMAMHVGYGIGLWEVLVARFLRRPQR